MNFLPQLLELYAMMPDNARGGGGKNVLFGQGQKTIKSKINHLIFILLQVQFNLLRRPCCCGQNQVVHAFACTSKKCLELRVQNENTFMSAHAEMSRIARAKRKHLHVRACRNV